MAGTAGAVNELRHELDALVEAVPAGTPPGLAEAVRGLMAAIDYNDPALIRSHWETMREAVVTTADAEIDRLLVRAERTKVLCDRVRALDAAPVEEYDRLGRALEQLFAGLGGSIDRLRATWIDLARKYGANVSKAAALDDADREIQILQERTLRNWPWSSGGLPPVDRGMVNRSREARARGEGFSIEEAIRRVAGRPADGGQVTCPACR